MASANVTISEVSANDLRINLNGATFDGTSTAAASGLTYQNAGSPATSTFADLNITTLNAITLLTANLTVAGDQLNFGAINDTVGSLGNLTGMASTINVNGVVDLTHATTGNGAVTLTAPTALNIAGTGGISSTNGNVTLNANSMALGGAINDGGKTVTLSTVTASRPVTIGTKPGTSLGLFQSELSQITAGSPVIVQGGGTFDVGDASNSLSFLTSDISLVGTSFFQIIDGPSLPNASITLHDEGNSAVRVYIITSTEVNPGGTGRILYSNMGALTLNGGQGGDQMNVLSTPISSFFSGPFFSFHLNLNGGAGNDTFNLGASLNSLERIGANVSINGGGFSNSPSQTFTVGVNGATVSKTLPVGDLVQIIDQNGATVSYTLTASTIQYDPTGHIITLANTQSLNVFLSPNSTVTASSTPDGIDQIYGNGNNTENVQTTQDNSVLVIKASTVGSKTNITTTGAGSLVFINGNTGADSLFVTTTGSNSGVEFDGGAGNDSVVVGGTGTGSLTLITDTGGTNHYYLSNVARSLNDIQGKVSFFGASTSSLTFDDEGDSSTRTYTLANNNVTRTGAAQVFYAGIAAFLLNGSSGNDTYDITSGPPGRAAAGIFAFPGEDVTGTGLDAGIGNNAFNVTVSVVSGYNLFLAGGSGVGGVGGTNTLTVTDVSGGATIKNTPSSLTDGTVTVDYTNPGAKHSRIVDGNIQTVKLVQPPPPPSGAPIVKLLFNEILGRSPSSDEAAAFTNYLNGNGEFALVNLLEHSPEGLAQTVSRYFQELLGRLPNADELRTGVNLLQQGRSEVSMLGTLMGMSDAFQSLDFRKREVTLDFVRLLGRAPSQLELLAFSYNPNLSLTVIRELLEAGGSSLFNRFA